MTSPHAMSTSELRAHLSQAILRVQDPRDYIVITRSGRPVAAMISMKELRRLWDYQDHDDRSPLHPVTGRPESNVIGIPAGYTRTEEGALVTPSEAAEEMRRRIEMRQAEERVLRLGGIDPNTVFSETELEDATPGPDDAALPPGGTPASENFVPCRAAPPCPLTARQNKAARCTHRSTGPRRSSKASRRETRWKS
ncbi:MAG: type II toxin-antitoxin system Phd/YefM family antitoxin [Rhodobacteraceae bacterium]|nr:type II toxin-antitoxin system Phd/YefM family antitoxin [Paracoccaceae bacterium]